VETRFVFPCDGGNGASRVRLFGVKWPHHALTDLTDKAVIRGVLPPPISVDLEPPEKLVDLTQAPAAAKGDPDAFKPEQDEPLARPSDFEQTMQPRLLAPTSIVHQISDKPFGVLDGIEGLEVSGIEWATSLDNTPRTRSQAAPAYPAAERTAGITGEVLVEFIVDESGRVLNPRVVRSSGVAFESPTLRAVMRWRFEPGKKDGRLVRFRMMVPVRFNLDM